MARQKYLQGKFKPQNPKKYIGNVNNIIYRSGWELLFLRRLDTSPDVIRYASEEFVIRYYNPIKMRWARYFPDFLIETKGKDGKTSKLLVEIKPLTQVTPPTRGPKKKMQTYMNEMMEYSVNKAKWSAAKEWCKKNEVKFCIVTKMREGDSFQILNEDQLGL